MMIGALHGLLAVSLALGIEPASHPERTDQHGDPLPAGALARLGTVRWRPGTDIDFLGFADAGRLLVAREPYGVFHIYEVASGKEVRRLGLSQRDPSGGSYSPSKTVLSPGGRFLASIGGRERVLHLWEVASGKELWQQRLARTANFVEPVAFSADGKVLATWEDRAHSLSLCDTAGGKELGRIELPARPPAPGVDFPPDTTFAPDGNTLATVGPDAVIRLWSIPAGKLLHKLGKTTDPGPRGDVIMKPVFSGDSKTLTTLFTSGRDNSTLGTMIVWDLETGKEVRRVKGPEGGITGVVLSPDGALVVWSGAEGGICLQEIATRKVRQRLGKVGQKSGGVAIFSPDGKTLFVQDGYPTDEDQLWDVQSGKELWKRKGDLWASPAVFAPDGKALALFHRPRLDGMIRLLDAATGKEITVKDGHEGAVGSLSVSADGKTITSLASDDTVRQWDAATGKELRRFSFPESALTLSLDGRRVAVSRDVDGVYRIEVRDLDTDRTVWRTETIQGKPVHLAFAPDGRTLAGEKLTARASFNYLFRLYDAESGKERRLLDDPDDQYLDHILFSPDGSTLATAWSNEGPPDVVYLSQVSTGRQLRRLPIPENISVLALAFSPDGRTLAMLYSVRAAPDTIVLWETATGQERGRIRGGVMAYDSAKLSFAPDGRALAVGGADHVIRLWGVHSGKLLGKFSGHHGGITCLAFSADGKCLVSGSADTTALVWDAAPLLRQADVPTVELSAGQLEAHWAALAGADARRAFQAIKALSASPAQTVSWIRERLKPAVGVEEQRLARLIVELNDDKFAVREKARLELEALGEMAGPALAKVMETRPTLEQARRVRRVLDRLEPDQDLSPEVLQMLRAVEVLEQVRTPEARRLLQELAEGAPAARLTRECRAALKRLAVP